jgi:hypothetical protein
VVRNRSIRGSLDDLQIVPEAEVDIPGLQVIPLRVAEERLAHRLRSGGWLDRMHWRKNEARRLTSGLIGVVLQNRLCG